LISASVFTAQPESALLSLGMPKKQIFIQEGIEQNRGMELRSLGHFLGVGCVVGDN
jgi:hypothetical protein